MKGNEERRSLSMPNGRKPFRETQNLDIVDFLHHLVG